MPEDIRSSPVTHTPPPFEIFAFYKEMAYVGCVCRETRS